MRVIFVEYKTINDCSIERPRDNGSAICLAVLLLSVGFTALLPKTGEYIAKHDPYAPLPRVQYEQNRSLEKPIPAGMNDSLKVMKKYI